MSRNFELLQKLGKELEMLDYGWETDIEAVAPPQPATNIQPPHFDLEPGQRDEVMKLVQRIFLVGSSEAPRIVTFCGLEPGGDSGWICSRAAEVLASKVAGSICVVDANFREPGLHRHFGVECGIGLTEALQQNDPIKQLVRPIRQNLWFLSCGNQAEEWQALLASDRTRARISELRAQFDYVLIDGPALNPSNDVVALGNSSQGVVLVLKANSSRREVAREAVKDFGRAGVRVLGAVLSGRTFPIPDKIYKRL